MNCPRCHQVLVEDLEGACVVCGWREPPPPPPPPPDYRCSCGGKLRPHDMKALWMCDECGRSVSHTMMMMHHRNPIALAYALLQQDDRDEAGK